MNNDFIEDINKIIIDLENLKTKISNNKQLKIPKYIETITKDKNNNKSEEYKYENNDYKNYKPFSDATKGYITERKNRFTVKTSMGGKKNTRKKRKTYKK